MTGRLSVFSLYYDEQVRHGGTVHTAPALPAVAKQEPHPIVPEPPWQWLLMNEEESRGP